MDNKKIFSVAIDGPSGAGKSTVSRAVAAKLGIVYVDTGAMYRAIGLYVKRKGISPDDKDGVISCLPDIKINLSYENGEQRVFLGDEDVSTQIRENEISTYASKVSAIGEVRKFLLGMQQSLAKIQSVIMDGRDIGTVVLPNAELKIFITASEKSRAERRYKELIARGQDITFEKVLYDMVKRDEADRGREIAPAVPAEDAIIFDNSNYDLEGSIEYVIKLIEDKVGISK